MPLEGNESTLHGMEIWTVMEKSNFTCTETNVKMETSETIPQSRDIALFTAKVPSHSTKANPHISQGDQSIRVINDNPYST